MKTAIIVISLLAVAGLIFVLLVKPAMNTAPAPPPPPSSAPTASIGQSLAANSGDIITALASMAGSFGSGHNVTNLDLQDAATGA